MHAAPRMPIWLWASVVLGTALPASAGDSCHAPPCGHRAPGCDVVVIGGGHRSDCRPYGRYRSGGTSWARIRAGLAGKELIRHAYIRGYFLRRYGVLFAEAGHHGRPATQPEWAGAAQLLVEADAPAANLDPLDRLNRGVAKMAHGLYAEAGPDLEASLAANPQQHGARLGRALCSAVAGAFPRAAADLAFLAAAGELRPDDRLEEHGCLREGGFDALLAGVEAYAAHRPSQGDVRLVLGWLLTLDGRPEEAARWLEPIRSRAAAAALLGRPAVVVPASPPRRRLQPTNAPDVPSPRPLDRPIAEARTAG